MKIAFVIALAGACSVVAPAQDPQVPPVLEIQREFVKEGRSAAHEKVGTDYARAFRKSKTAPNYLALTSMSGPGEAWFLIGYPSFAAVEKSEQALEKSPLKNDLDNLDARDGELRSSSRTMYAVLRKDLSYQMDSLNLAKTRYVAISTFRVKLGHEDEFTAGAKMFLSAREKAGINHSTICYQVIAGAPDGVFLFMEPMQSLQDWDEIPQIEKKTMEAMGEDNMRKLMKGAGDVFSTMENNLFAVNPRMSFVSKTVEDADPAFWRAKAPAPAKASAAAAKPNGQ